MSLRLKALIALLLITIFLSIGMYASSEIFIVGNIKKQEAQETQNTINLAMNILRNETDSISSTCGDWSSWDDTYRFIEDRNQNYIDVNLVDTTFETLKLNLMVFINSSNEIVYEKVFALDNNSSDNLSEKIKSQIFKNNVILKHEKAQSIVSGIFMIDNTPVLFSARPITDSNAAGEIKGTLIMGRSIDIHQINELESFTQSKVIIQNSIDRSYYESNNYKTLSMPNGLISYMKPLNKDFNESAVIIKDVFNKDAFTMKFQTERTIYALGYYGFKVFIISFYILMLLIIAFAVVAFNKLFLLRIEKLNGFINDVILNKDTLSQIQMDGNDEISNLSKKLNHMLDNIYKSEEKLIENERRLSLVMEGSSDGFWDYNLSTKKVYLSSRLMSMLNYGNSELIRDMGNMHKKYINPDDLKRMMHIYNIYKADTNSYFNEEIRILSKSGQWLWMQVKGKIVEWDNNDTPARLAGIISDITERKKYEEEIKYISYHDNLTGLYNRSYLIEELDRLDKEGNLPLSIIMGDVNGLKLTNDAFGHKEGDNLLIILSTILTNVCKSDGFAARLGGDEFVLVLPHTDEAAAEILCESIWNQCEEQENKLIKPSLALGFATKYSADDNVQGLLEIAEDRMYKNKLLEDTSSRHSLIASMERSLLETDYETEEHARRLEQLSIKLGRYIKLPSNAYDELSLLSRLHDIGKIAISTEILSKSGKLTEEEWGVIKRHPEIGYRIALSSNDLIPIAESILSHHEKWDGTGYPKGLKGDNIPLLARIISIVDAYDVITHIRPYKQASSHKEAIEEIKKCSGTHFDPYLTKAFIEMFSDV